MSELVKLNEIKQTANKLKAFVVEQGLFTNIQGKNFVHVEGWQFAGASLGIQPVVKEVTNLNPLGENDEVKWQASVELYRGDQLVGAGVAICSNKERGKKSFDEYAIISMAQTRAISKAYRNSIGWIMKLAGYETTPAEEMDNGTGNKNTDKPDDERISQVAKANR